MAEPDYNYDSGAGGGGTPAPTGKRPFNPTTDRVLEKQTLPGGYTQITYLDADGNVQVGLLSPQESQSSGSSGYTPASGGQVLANQFDQQQLAQQNEQFFQNMGYEKARFGIEQEQRRAEQAAAEARNNRDFAAEQHWNQVGVDLKQQQFQLDQQAQQFGQYTKLADLASNPRNFVQTFFMNRGQQPPADVARYGNTTQNASQIVPFQQFQQQYMAGAGAPLAPQPAAPTYANPVVSQTGAQYPQGSQINDTSSYGSSYQGLSGFEAGTNKPRLSPNDPDAAGLMARNPGMYAMTSQEEAMKYLPQKKPAMFAQGGKLQMMGPHAVINLMTGKTVAIAGEERAPGGGFVPENAYFDGEAMIDPGLGGNPYDPPQPQFSKSPGGGIASPAYIDPATQGYVDPFSNQLTGSTISGGTTTGAGSSYSPPVQNWTPEDLAAMIAQANAGNTQTTATTGDPYAVQAAPQYPQAPTITPQIQPIGKLPSGPYVPEVGTPEPPPTTSSIPPSVIQPPTALPQTNRATGQTTFSPSSPVSNITPASLSAPGTFGQPIPAKMPTYLGGENFTAASPVTEAVRNLPFMQRTWAQGRGDPTMGTNTPQRTDLPPDLPLISQLGWQQLSPSEQQAFLSYVSSLGITPEDYLAMIAQNSPQGGTSYQPNFGNQAPFSRQ